jgi:hypothetical protein
LALFVVVILSGCAAEPSEWEPAFDAREIGWLMSVWAPSDGTRLAVGGSPEVGLVVRFDGTSWERLAIGVEVPLLNWIHGFEAADEVVIVGNGGTVLRYDGTSFRRDETLTRENLWGVWGARPDALWAVGGSGRPTSEATLLFFDGVRWAPVDLPPLERADVHALFKVWGSAEDDVYAVGQRGVVLHYDGAEWREQQVGASDDLISLWGTGPNEVVAVGGRSNGIMARFDGTAWQTVRLGPLPGLNGVWMGQPGVAHAVGARGTALTIDTRTLTIIEDRSVLTSLDFHAVFGGRGRLHAVGGSLASSAPPFQGLAYTRRLGAHE